MVGAPGRRLVGLFAAFLILGSAVPAVAQGPEDGSAFDQYLEGVPGRGGEYPSHHAVGSRGAPLSPEAASALRRLGPTGERTAAVATKITPAPDKGRDGDGPEEKGGLGAAVDELLDPNGEGLGFVLPLILAGTLIVGLAVALRRRLGRPGATP